MEKEADVKKYLDQFCIEEKPGPCAITIFGASGDLVSKKLIPSLFELYKKALLPKNFYIIGFARTLMNTDTFRERIKKSLKENLGKSDKSSLKEFLGICYYQSGNYLDSDAYKKLQDHLRELDDKYLTGGNHIFYFGTPPNLYIEMISRLGVSGLIEKPVEGRPWVRVVIEKPFGRDLESACELNNKICETLTEDQVYRIDHYLGKETVQNILMFRFANIVFEPIWNNNYIDHIQITAAESAGVGHRAGYYEQAGLLRDMFQNHMLQLLSLVTMDEPASFEAENIRNKRVELLKSIRPFSLDDLGNLCVRGQYIQGKIDNKEVCGYRQESRIDPASSIETFVAAKMFLDVERWRGVPFYLRSGKRMPKKITEITVVFKPVKCKLFSNISGINLAPNILTLNIQPEEGVSLVIQAKHPGPKLCMSSLTMDFCYKDIFGSAPPEAYQRLLLDCMLGDQTLFIRRDGMEAAWALITPVLKKWEYDQEACPLHYYTAGSPGPAEASKLLSKDGRYWMISKGFC